MEMNMGYTEQRNMIDKIISQLPEDKQTFFLTKLKKIDARKGGSHRIGITGILSMLKAELTNNQQN